MWAGSIYFYCSTWSWSVCAGSHKRASWGCKQWIKHPNPSGDVSRQQLLFSQPYLKALTKSCEPQSQHTSQDRTVLKMGCFPLLSILLQCTRPCCSENSLVIVLQAPLHPWTEKSSPSLHSHGSVNQSQAISASVRVQGGGRMPANVTADLGLATRYEILRFPGASLTSSCTVPLQSSCGIHFWGNTDSYSVKQLHHLERVSFHFILVGLS